MPKGSQVHIWVSTGLPKAEVPDLVGQQSTDAVAALTKLAPEARPAQVPSAKPAGRGDARRIRRPGTKLTVGELGAAQRLEGPAADRRARASIGEPIDQATSELQAAGFKVSPTLRRRQPAGEHRDRPEPERAAASAGKGSVVSLTVSKGPKTSTVPDVTSYDLGSAEQTLQASGFKSQVVHQDVTDPNQVGIVLAQDPAGGTQAAAEDRRAR